MTKICNKCGAMVGEESKFCSSCGNLLVISDDNDKKSSSGIENENSSTQLGKTEDNLEMNQEKMDENSFFDFNSSINRRKIRSKKEKKNFSPKQKWQFALIRTFVIILISVVLFGMAFVSIMDLSYNQDAIDMDKYEGMFIECSSIDAITFMFDSVKSIEDEDIEDSVVYNEFEKALEESKEIEFEEWDDLTAKEKSICIKAYKLSFRTMLQSERYVASPTLIATGIIAILYLVACVLTMIFAVLHILSLFRVIPYKPNTMWRATLICLFAIPFIIVAIYFGLSNSISIFTNLYNMNVGGGFITTIVLVGLTFLGIVLTAQWIDRKEKIGFISKSISMVLSILVMSIMFAPILSTELNLVFNGKEEKSKVNIEFYQDYFTSFTMSEDDAKDLYSRVNKMFNEYSAKEDYADAKIYSFSQFSKKAIEEGTGQSLVKSTLFEISIRKGILEYRGFFECIPLAYIISILLLAFISSFDMLYLCTGYQNNWIYLTLKSICLFMVIFGSGFIITYGELAKWYIESYFKSGLEIASIGIGSIFVLVFQTINMFFGDKKMKVTKIHKKRKNILRNIIPEELFE
ncbi:MAG: zinc ribbon domain-containing protein [Clostridia bacterium]|nr:zinc ribbon domain-containing protein [Clostridia bacterium]